MLETSPSQLVLTKLRVPRPRPRTVDRARLVDRVASEPGKALTLVSAPAGYGKTTLLAEWSRALSRAGAAIAWYALDSSDDDPSLFAAYLVASVSQALGPTPDLTSAAQLLRSTPGAGLERVLPAVINAVAGNDLDVKLVLDDYHLVSAPAIHSAIAFLLEHLPENMQLAVGSRADPPLPLARLRARGQLSEIRTADLRFTSDEASQFLNVAMRLDLSPEEAAELTAHTEGWVAGLQLAALSLVGRVSPAGFASSLAERNRYVVEYMLQEVVERQASEVQEFLLLTSVLERMCGSLCDALLSDRAAGDRAGDDRGGSSAILERLERANLFVVPLDEQGDWYRYHHVFQDFLRQRLGRTQPDRAAELHRSASEWYESNGYLREAVGHAVATGDWAYAADVVERLGMTMLMHSEISTVHDWCAAFPEGTIGRHPMLCIIQGWTLVLGYRGANRAKVETRLRLAEEAASALEDRQHGRWLAGQAAVVRAFLGLIPDPAADPRQELAIAQTALDLLPPGDPLRSTTTLAIGYAQMGLQDVEAARRAMEEARELSLAGGNHYGLVEATFHLARLAHSQGRLSRAAEICRQGRERIAAVLPDTERELPAVGSLDIALGCALLDMDRLAEAEEALLHGLDLIGWTINPYYQLTACVALFRLRELQGRDAEALAYLDRLHEVWPDAEFCTEGLRVMHALRIATGNPGALSAAADWCHESSPSFGEGLPLPGIGPLGAAEAYYLASVVWVRAQIALGAASAPLPYLERSIAMAEAHGLIHRLIELSLAEVEVRQALGESKRAWDALHRALSLAESGGYLRIFDQGPAANRLLAEAARRGISRTYVGRILEALGAPGSRMEQVDSAAQTPRPAHPQGALVEPLSERELEVLRLIARGASNQAIADQLVITVGTVKGHTNHILGKLGVRNRTEAVARGRELGLLDT